MLFTWKPKPKKTVVVNDETKEVTESEVASQFEGEVKFVIPTYSQRLRYIKETNIGSSDEGLTEIDGIDRLEKMVEIAKKHIKEVNLVRIEDGFKFDSLELLELDRDGGEVLAEVSQSILAGVKLGNG